MRRVPISFAGVLLLIAPACTVERGDSPFEAQTFADVGVSSDVAPGGDVALGTGSGAGTISGTWLQIHEASTCVVVDEQLTWAWYLVDIEQQGRVLVESRRQCDFDLSPVFGLEPTVPEATRKSVRFIDVDNGLVSSVSEGGSYTSSTEVGLWGLELDSPLSDPVPTEPDAPAVVDADDDGNPGITFGTVGSDCQRYVTQRSVVRYFGTFVAPNQIDGDSITVTDSHVIGSSEPLCGIDPRITSNDQHSRFRMVRVDGLGEAIDLDDDGDGTVSCAEAEPWFDRLIERREASPDNCN